jgi:hypothetical protein
LYPLFTLHDYSNIENKKTFLIGTTNQMVINHGKIKYDCVVNIDTNKISINNEIPEKILKMSKTEKKLPILDSDWGGGIFLLFLPFILLFLLLKLYI